MSQTIALVEDEPDIAGMLREVLAMEGYEVTVFHDPEGVVEKVTEVRPDAFLIDIMLPGRSGIELAQDLRRQGYADACLIAMSASRPMTYLARQCGLFVDTLDKPFDLQKLFGVLARSMDQDAEGHGWRISVRPMTKGFPGGQATEE